VIVKPGFFEHLYTSVNAAAHGPATSTRLPDIRPERHRAQRPIAIVTASPRGIIARDVRLRSIGTSVKREIGDRETSRSPGAASAGRGRGVLLVNRPDKIDKPRPEIPGIGKTQITDRASS
jgi:hypothetical protein